MSVISVRNELGIPEGKLLLNKREAAAALSIDPSTLWRMSERNEIPSVKVGPKMRRWRVSDLEAYVRSLR